ncbi:hypothetical protein [Niveibacterium sp.]|uniref:hypothetical protein n=1 Tax=Niveibacterium sp. TaxID=2017444 RepID=UPI0035B46F8A
MNCLGFVTHTGAKGKDGFGDDIKLETPLDAVRMADVGNLAGKKDTVFAGVGHEYWQNKFGANHAAAPGANTSTGMRKAE